MEAIREIHTVKNGSVNLQLPESFWGQSVEIIVLPAKSNHTATNTKKCELRGVLKQYAKSDLQAQESQAWAEVIEDKYGSH